MSALLDKVKALPLLPGVYLFKDDKGRVIYIGKAGRLRTRVSSYFRNVSAHDPKTGQLVTNIRDLAYIETPGEIEALFLESELIKRYNPKYNVVWQDEKNFLYVKVTLSDEFPTVEYVRRPLSDKSYYLGPFVDGGALRSSLRILRKVFPYHLHPKMPKRACLDYHLGLCAGPEIGAVSKEDYRKMIKRLIAVIEGREKKVVADLKKEMLAAAKAREFEQAARARDRLQDLLTIRKKILFSDKESLALSADQGLVELAEVIGLPAVPHRIEAYDISHLQGSATAASMIVFQDGIPRRDEYRHFRVRTVKGVDDFESLREVVSRRFGKPKDWARPDLILIDGGKGQLAAVDRVLKDLDIMIPRIGLAKRAETIVLLRGEGGFREINLKESSDALKLLQRIRDEAHRFAITYHSLLAVKRTVTSGLDTIPGVGDKTKKKLIKAFGSARAVAAASREELAPIVGPKLATVIKERL